MARYLSKTSSFRIVVAAATLLAPLASTANEPVPTNDKRWLLTPQTVAVARINLARVLRTPVAELWPTEVLTAAGLQYVGFDPLTIKRAEIAIEPPLGPQLYYAARLDMSRTFSLDELTPQVLDELIRIELPTGRIAYSIDPNDPNAPMLTMLDEQTLIAASPGMMKKLFKDNRKPAGGDFFDWVDSRSTDVDAHIGVNFEPLRPLANMAIAFGLRQAAAEIEAPLYDLIVQLAKAPDEVEYIEAWVDMTSKGQAGVAIETADSESADRLAESLEALREINIVQLEMAAAELDRTDPTQSALADYFYRIGPAYADSTQPIREGTRFKRVVPPEDGNDYFAIVLTQTAVIGVLAALLLPAVQAAREAARRNVSLNNVKLIALALHNYYDVHNHFPPYAITAPDGTPLLSWRVAILPYLGEDALYRRFALDESWDSPTNRPLLARMPDVFVDPSGRLDASTGRTHYLGALGDGAFFASSLQPRRFGDFRDGTAPTIAIVQVDDENAVEWTKPADYDVTANTRNPVGGIGSLHPGAFLAGFADGHAQSIREDEDVELLRAMFTIDGGERIELP